MNEFEVSNFLVDKLLNMGFTVHRYYAHSTNSIYLKLDLDLLVVLEFRIIQARKNIVIDLM